MFNKYAGDLIAQEMFKFMKKADDSEVSHGKDQMHHADDESDDKSWDAEDFLMSHNSEDDLAEDEMSMSMDAMADYAMDDSMDSMDMIDDDVSDSGTHSDMGDDKVASASDLYLMNGLGKIEASLRRKGEGFAADLVRATAYEIREDIVKQAKQKDQVLKELVKMASNLMDRGDRRAAQMVRMTINKINR